MYSVCAGCLLPSPAKTNQYSVIMTTVVSGSLLSPFHRNLETPNVTTGTEYVQVLLEAMAIPKSETRGKTPTQLRSKARGPRSLLSASTGGHWSA